MENNIEKIKIIGLGGIGSYLLDPISRYLSYSEKQYEITFIDGDFYEEKNLDRQNFSLFQNKAKDAFERMQSLFKNIHFKYKPEYVNEDNVVSLIRNNDIIFLCVDNHSTRKTVSDRCKELDNVVLISGGNDLIDGNVIVYIRKKSIDITRSLTDLDPRISNPKDSNPSTLKNNSGCQNSTQSEPQLLFTNFAVASMMLNCFRRYENNDVNFHQVYIDIQTLRTRPSPEIEIEKRNF
jgi:molybdopterin/thiamine biosynthesis adenylyltransferase